MKSIKIVLSIFASLFIFISCEKDIEFNGEITDPLIVVNSYITPDSVVSAHISESRFFLKDSITYKNINNADVSVWVNGVFKEKMNLVEKGMYHGTYKPIVGETIKIIVNVPTRKEVSCETKIYSQPVINSIDTANIWTGDRYEIQSSGTSYGNGPMTWVYDTIATVTGHTINYTLKFNDNANEQNFYRLVVQNIEHYTVTDTIMHTSKDSIMTNYYFNFTDVVSGNNTTNDPTAIIGGGYYSYNMYNAFSDELFNGKTYSLTFSTNEDICKYSPEYTYGRETPDRKEIKIYLQSISRDYYLYLKSRAAGSGGENFFSEPVQIHNNIVGGIGILGSYTSSLVYKFDL
ncbi:MAG: DUF4249 domain-containing protein [Paludibacter sp.]|nr:DUF4249 domain-containing protein [Paludibacter sp.]